MKSKLKLFQARLFCAVALGQGDGQSVAQASRLRVLAASRRQKRKN